jgi:hypothetical protein
MSSVLERMYRDRLHIEKAIDQQILLAHPLQCHNLWTDHSDFALPPMVGMVTPPKSVAVLPKVTGQ